MMNYVSVLFIFCVTKNKKKDIIVITHSCSH